VNKPVKLTTLVVEPEPAGIELVWRAVPSIVQTTIREAPLESETFTETVATTPVTATHVKVLGAGHVIAGPVEPRVAIVWLHVFVLPQASVASHVRVATKF
jgi:hypothetical protein